MAPPVFCWPVECRFTTSRIKRGSSSLNWDKVIHRQPTIPVLLPTHTHTHTNVYAFFAIGYPPTRARTQKKKMCAFRKFTAGPLICFVLKIRRSGHLVPRAFPLDMRTAAMSSFSFLLVICSPPPFLNVFCFSFSYFLGKIYKRMCRVFRPFFYSSFSFI